MVLDNELQEAVARALSSLPGDSHDSFADWHSHFRDTSVGWRYLYGAHVVHIVDFDTALSESLVLHEATPQDVITLCKRTLALPAERLGLFDEHFLCLRLEDSTFANSGRMLVFERASIEGLVLRLFPGASLTPAELRMLFQVVCGVTLKEAAVEDGVSHETKRSQLKSVSSKTGRKGQREIAGFVVARLLFDLLQAPGSSEETEDVLHQYCDRFLPGAIRLHIIRRRDGTLQRLLEFGDRRGFPLIVLHAQALPAWSDKNIALVSSMGLRMIWPLRHGVLDPDANAVTFKEHAAMANDGIECARELFAGDQVVLISLMSACWYGINYAQLNPDTISQMVLVGACYRPNNSDTAPGLFRSGFLRLSGQHRALAGMVLKFVGQRIRDTDRLKTFLQTLYADSQADLAVLADEFADQSSSESLMQRFVFSERSILHDFLHLGFPNFNVLNELTTPIDFIHGKEDPVHSVDNITALAKSLNAPLHVLPKAGQLMYRDHWPDVVKAVACSLRSDPLPSRVHAHCQES